MTEFLLLSFAVFTLMEAYIVLHEKFPRLPDWLSSVAATILALGTAYFADLPWLTGLAAAGGCAIVRQVGLALYTFAYHGPTRRR